MKKIILAWWILFGSCFCIPFKVQSHDINYSNIILHEWNVNRDIKIKASFLMIKNDQVYLQKENSETIHFPFSSFSLSDQEYILQRYQRIQQMNALQESAGHSTISHGNSIPVSKILIAGVLLILILAASYFWGGEHKLRNVSLFSVVAGFSLLYSFNFKSKMQAWSVSDPLSVDSSFTPFKPNVVTSWDSNYFYVESYGIPTTHGMMTGIVKWQQQVPIPQCYIKPNAWMIPLNPVIAANPVPVDSIHFTRGAIAVAANGIPIFNYHTNTGVDAYLDGQLDQWGGHCGRADDYHYHIAPLHLYNYTSNTLPVAYALDGFAVYGNYEPDGTNMLPLDANNGHYGANGVYHYHGVATAPYMIGKMVGAITEDTTHQIIPQPHANPVRPALTPLSGAVITDCIPNGNNGYTLIYTLGGNTDSVVYSWTAGGIYSFDFYTISGHTASTYNGFIPCQLPTYTDPLNAGEINIRVSPNPSHNAFSLILNNSIHPGEIKNILIINELGETVLTANEYREKFNTATIPAGVYFLILKTESRVLTKKIIIQ